MKQILACAPTQLIVLGSSNEGHEGLAALANGAVVFLPRSSDAARIVAMVEAVHRGSPLKALTDSSGADALQSWPGQEFGLSARESEVIVMIIDGLGNEAIGLAIYLSINSVKTHIRTAYRKMDVASRSQAVVWGIDHGMRRPPQEPLPV